MQPTMADKLLENFWRLSRLGLTVGIDFFKTTKIIQWIKYDFFIAARVFLSYTWTCTPPTLAPSIWRGGSDARPSATPWRTHIRSPVISQIVSGLVFSVKIIGLYSKGMQYLLRGVVQWRLGWGSWSVPPVSTRQSWVTLKTVVCGFPQSFGSSSPCSALTELVLK